MIYSINEIRAISSRIYFFVLIFLLTGFLQAQTNVAGVYRFNNYIVYKLLDLKPDSSFTWHYQTDSYVENRTGKWKINGDTLLLFFNTDSFIGKFSKNGKNFYIDTIIYKEGVCKLLIIGGKKLEINYWDEDEPVEYFFNKKIYVVKEYYHKLLEYNSKGIIIREYKYCYHKRKQYLCMETESYPNGIKKRIIEYNHKGLKHGTELEFYENGAMKFMGKWKNGHSVGKWYFFNRKGELIKVKKATVVYKQN